LLGWFIGRVLCRSARNDIVRAQTGLTAQQQLHLAHELAHRMARVERIGNRVGMAAANDAARNMLSHATRDRHNCVAKATGSLNDPEWLLAALSETWSNARIASLERRITAKAFCRVDAIIGKYLIAVLGNDEVCKIATGNSLL
jgi:hypothetical protein